MYETLTVTRGYQYKLEPTEEQENKFKQTIGCARFMYNLLLEERNKTYTQTGKHKILTPAKFKSEYSFLREVDSLALANEQLNLKKAFNNHFSNPSHFGESRFHSKKKHKQSYTTSVTNNNIRLEDDCIRLPKVGSVKIKLHRNPPENSRLKLVTITHLSDGTWIVSILFEYEIQVNKMNASDVTDDRIVGLDYSNPELYVDNTGNEPHFLKPYRKSLERLKREQRKLSKMQKDSKNYEKQRVKVARMHYRIANQRKDFQHKLANRLVKDYDCVCIEDLDMKEIANDYGKSVHDNAWGQFIELLSYKLADQGKFLIKIDKYFPSSQLCHKCGFRNPFMKDVTKRTFVCPCGCGEFNRDVNAAINIKNEGTRFLRAS